MTIIVPLDSVPSQKQKVILADQNVGVFVYLLDSRLYADLTVDDEPIVTAVLCQNLVRIVDLDHYGFIGDLVFYDTQGESDPTYDALGSRYVLVYLP